VAEDPSIYDAPSFVVTTDDGTMFSCVPQEATGRTHGKRRYWSLMCADGVLCVGPPYDPRHSAADVQRLVNDWWRQKKTT
jgi:hypothetical protein